MSSQHQEKIYYKCYFCEEKFEKKSQLDLHCEQHAELVKVRCKGCKKDVDVDPRVKIQQIHRENEFQCENCADKAESNQKELEKLVGLKNLRKKAEIKNEGKKIN
jgi:DNA-directed RNA polymerase subunit RPC12/RpoP